MNQVQFAVNMRSTGRVNIGPRRPEIRIAPSLENIGAWEWAIVEEARATTPAELAKAQAERKLLANGTERDPLMCAMAAVSALAGVMAGETHGKR